MERARGRAHFSGFVFDPATGELERGGEKTRLQPQPAQVLSILLHRAGDLVTREDLKKQVWPETVVEFDQGLNYCIRQIRAALGDSADSPRFIGTLARRGYRFLERVEWDVPGTAPAWRKVAIAVGVIVAVGLTVAFALVSDRADEAVVPIRVAVVPLREERAGHPLTESLVTQLTNLGAGLEVLGPATTAGLETDPRPDTEIGASLEVAYMVSGGIRSTDSGLFVQAVRVTDGAHIFARIIPQPAVRADTSMRRLAVDLARGLREDRATGDSVRH